MEEKKGREREKQERRKSGESSRNGKGEGADKINWKDVRKR